MLHLSPVLIRSTTVLITGIENVTVFTFLHVVFSFDRIFFSVFRFWIIFFYGFAVSNGPQASLLYQSRWNKGSLRLSYPPPIRQSVAPMQLAEVFFNISATSNAISFKGVWQWIVPFRGNQPKIKSLLSGHKWPQSAVMTTLLHRGNMAPPWSTTKNPW